MSISLLAHTPSSLRCPELALLWEAAGRDVTQEGLFTAGDELGSYSITVAATLGDGKATGSATMRIILPGLVA